MLLIATIVSSVHDFRIEKWVSDPQVRSGATMTAFGDDLYLLMGFNECFDFINLPGCSNIFYNSTEIWKYSTINQQWDKIIPTSTSNPPSRAFHTATLTDCKTSACPSDSIVVYGGSNYQYLSDPIINIGDMWSYDISTNEWMQIIANNEPYGSFSVTGQSILAKDDYIYSFGGLTEQFVFVNELWRYSFATNNWVELIPSDGIAPTGRYINRAIWANDDRTSFLIYGGNTGFGVSDAEIWEYNIAANQWTLLNDGAAVHPSGCFSVVTVLSIIIVAMTLC